MASTLAVGDELTLRTSDGNTLLFGIESMEPATTDAGAGKSAATVLLTNAVVNASSTPGSASPPGDATRVERLRFDMEVRLGDRTLIVEDLGFNAEHPRFWADLCLLETSLMRTATRGTEALQRAEFTQPSGVAARQAALFRLLQTGARIDPVRDGQIEPSALAGLVACLEPLNGRQFLPAGMASWLDPDAAVRPFAPGADNLERYDERAADLFRDPWITRLNDGSASALSADAFDRVYVQDRRLTGMHSLFSVDEAALVSVPDANHRNWRPGPSLSATPTVTDLPNQAEPAADLLRLCLEPPSIERIEPSRSSAAGGAVADIFGAGFVAGAPTVFFGATASADVNVVDGHLRCVVPPGRVGTATVVIVTEAGDSPPVWFTYSEPSIVATLPQLDDVTAFSLDSSPLLTTQRALITLCAARADMTTTMSLPQHFRQRQGAGLEQQRILGISATR